MHIRKWENENDKLEKRNVKMCSSKQPPNPPKKKQPPKINFD